MLLWFSRADHRRRLYVPSPGGKAVQTRLFLPRKPRLSELLQQIGAVIDYDARPMSEDSTTRVHGLLHVTPGAQWDGPLTNWGWQLQCLREYFLWPVDCFPLRVHAIAYLAEPLLCCSVKRRRRSGMQSLHAGILFNMHCFCVCIVGNKT